MSLMPKPSSIAHLWLMALLGLACLPRGRALPSLLSNCSYSYGTDLFTALREQERRWSQLAHLPPAYSQNESAMEWAGAPSVLGFSPLPSGTASLLQINVGFGTTGTTETFKKAKLSGRFASGCHWKGCFELPCIETQCPGRPNLLATHFIDLLECVAKPTDKLHKGQHKCRTEPWLTRLRKLLLYSFSRSKGTGELGAGLELFADTPAAQIFSEVLALVPLVTVQHSLRDPFAFVLRRVEHTTPVMCHPGKMSPLQELRGGALDILPCMKGSEFVYDKLVKIFQYVGASIIDVRRYLKGRQQETSMLPSAKELARASEGFSEYQFSTSTSVGHPVGHSGGLTRRQQLRLAEWGYWFARYNHYVLRHSHPERYEPVCVWDGND
ncbi:hypothetical protein B484DRAFT_471938 [Ochromonadaceae sp. CCMP2298]|nr:hypothetical protein B484DRAFT_471938 [Ochromonadaceae sp. CCMP2298]